MRDSEILQGCVNFIESNLKADITVKDVASYAGFSTSYFSEMFNKVIGMSTSSFFTKRRLLHAVYAVQTRKVVEASYDYGFDTYSGFYKAFKKEFGCSPRKYLKLCKVIMPKAYTVLREGRYNMTKTEIKNILKNWDLDEIEIFPIKIRGGKDDAINVWNISDKYVLKTGTDFSTLKRHIDISKEIKRQGLNANIPVLTEEGFEFLKQDDRYYYLSEKIIGNALSADDRYGGDIHSIANEYGKGIGILHQAFTKIKPNIELADGNLLKQVTEWALPITKNSMTQWNMELPQEFFEDYIESFGHIYPHLPQQIIHRDTHADNIIVNNNSVAGFVDFDISQKNVRLFGPCYCATGILSEADSCHDGLDKWPVFLENIINGYDKVIGITAWERKAIPYIIYSIQMICVAYFSENDIYKELAEKNRKMLKWFWENREICFKRFV